MKHLLLTTLFIALFNFNSTAQEVKLSKEFSYSVSTPYRVVDGMKSYFSRDGEILAVKYGRGKFHFQKFSGAKLNESKHNTVEKGEGFTPESYLEFAGQYYFFFSRWDKANETEQLFVREIDFDKANWAGKERLLIKVKGKVTGGFGITGFGGMFGITAGARGGKFNFDQSYSEERFIVQYRMKPKTKNDSKSKDIIGMHVYGKNLEEVWSKKITMPYTEKKMNNVGYTIDEKGNTYILAEVYRTETAKKIVKGKLNYDLELIRVSADDQDLSSTKIELEDKFIKNINFYEGKDGGIVIAGYYGNRARSGTDGVFIYKLDDSGDLIDKLSYEIPVDVMKLYKSDRAQSKMEKKSGEKDYSMPNMVLREIVYEEDGSITLYGERYYVVSHHNPKTGQTTYTYYYQEILATHIDKENELLWMVKLPKNQRGSAGRGGMGYYVLSQKNYHYVLFLDNVKNIELPLNKYPKTHQDGKGGFLTGFKIEKESGKVEKVSILDTRDAKGVALYQFNTGRIIETAEGEFAVECYKKKKEDVMLKITLND
ncbi:MAG: hypothetical protein COA33_009440 [Fluviicola sp.]|nr:hypothetical protein [Fluviicola sp.]